MWVFYNSVLLLFPSGWIRFSAICGNSCDQCLRKFSTFTRYLETSVKNIVDQVLGRREVLSFFTLQAWSHTSSELHFQFSCVDHFTQSRHLK